MSYNTTTPQCPKKIQPYRSSRLVGYRPHLYEYVLFYYIDVFVTLEENIRQKRQFLEFLIDSFWFVFA